MAQKYTKRAAWLLLILLVLDLSTASVCTAGTFPGFAAGSASGASVGVLAHTEGSLNADDDGCFCCCTHVLPGTHISLSVLAPALVDHPIFAVLQPTGLPQTLFHPPKS